MREEFYNASGSYCVFNDDGILCKSSGKNRFYPYGSINKIGFSLGSLDIQGKLNGENKGFIFVADGNDQKERIKALIDFARSQKKNAPKYDIMEFDLQKTVAECEAEATEYLRTKLASDDQIFADGNSEKNGGGASHIRSHSNAKTTQKDKASKKKAIGTIVAAVLAVLAVSSIFIVNRTRHSNIDKSIEAGNYAEAYSICAKMTKTQGIKDIMAEIEPYVWDEAEELYLSGDVAGAARIMDECRLDYRGYQYILDREYKSAVRSGLTHIVIPEGETFISYKAFEGCTELESVVIPDTVTKIGEYAFTGCTSLESIVIPDSVTEICESAFWKCTSLTDVQIADSVTKIGKYAFMACNALESIRIPNGVTEIADGTFFSCDSLINVQIPNSVTKIGEEAFYSCDSLVSIEIPAGVTRIGTSAFHSCISLESIVIPAGVTTIHAKVFEGCTSLASITIPGTVKAIDEWAFDGCTALEELVLEEGVEEIWSYAFYRCTSLTKVVIPSSITDIGIFAFAECDSLTVYCRCAKHGKWVTAWSEDTDVVWEYTGE